MRRSHSGIIGWRNDNPRHFRPRGVGPPQFRPGRGYGHGDTPRFPGPRFPGPRPYHNARPNEYMHRDQDRDYRSNRHSSQRYSLDNHDRNQHFSGNQGQRNIFPLLQRMRHEPADQNFYEDQDVDDRQSGGGSRSREPFTQRAPPWERRSPSKQYRNQDNPDKLPQADLPGHRPPASDHYGSNQGSTMENSKTFSRSVDDTVNIVRERLLSRESHPSCDTPPANHSTASESRQSAPATSQPPPQERSAKKKPIKAKNIKTNCDKIKNKIVHQLFKMDKDKIHKLMDNPNSSSKFEYAISSLITESQNSYNRHLRSVAEKSLGTSSEFIHNDTNTIYEDTFMKQMQSLLDPQDTVLLEDIKPMVLAELCKVLQLNDIEQRVEYEEPPYSSKEQYPYSDEFYSDYKNFNDEHYTPTNEIGSCSEQKVHMENRSQTTVFERSQSPNRNEDTTDFGKHLEPKPLFERRPPKNVEPHSSKAVFVRRDSERRSIDYKPEDSFQRNRTSVPVFEPITERPSEDDPFLELDKQYHVAVDPTFTETEHLSSPSQSNISAAPSQPRQTLLLKETPKVTEKPVLTVKPQTVVKNADKPPSKTKQEIEHEMLNIARTNLKIISLPNRNEPAMPTKSKEELAKQEVMNEFTISKPTNSTRCQTPESMSQENISKSNVAGVTPEITNNCSSIIKYPPLRDPRKRPAEQRPSHRKEKCKKSESPTDSTMNKQNLNKNIIINFNDYASDRNYDKSPNPVHNVNISKNKSIKESPKVDSSDKGYSDKYVKRKESTTPLSKKPKEDSKQKSDTSTSHSMSPAQTSAASAQTPAKPDTQIKLKPIDLFTGPSKKPTTVHQAPRNTAPVPVPTPKTVVETKPIIISRKLTKRHVATQTNRKILSKEVQTDEGKSSSTRYCQTERKRLISRGSQTDAVSFKSVAKVDPLERMKQIDMEIQVLLQEKFKLYSSIENPEPCGSTLGMAVLNPVDDDEPECALAEDDEFANIPVEELEQIAFDSEVEEQDDSLTENQNQQATVERGASRNCSQSPASSVSSGRSRRKAPNISLIEQIITDDRPLEDIISLDDFEESPDKRRLSKSDRRLDDIMSLAELAETPQRKNSQNKDRSNENVMSLEALEKSPQKSKSEKTDGSVEDVMSVETLKGTTQKKGLQKSDEPPDKGVTHESLEKLPLNKKSQQTDSSMLCPDLDSQKTDKLLEESIPPETLKLPQEENVPKTGSVELSLAALEGAPQQKETQKTEVTISVDTVEGQSLLKKMSQVTGGVIQDDTSRETLKILPSNKKSQKTDKSVEISLITLEGASQKKKLQKAGKSLKDNVDVLVRTPKKKLLKIDRPLKKIISPKTVAVLAIKKNSQKTVKALEEGISVETLKTPPQRRNSTRIGKALDDSMPLDTLAGQKKKSLKMDRNLNLSLNTKEGKKKSPKTDKALEIDRSLEIPCDTKEGSPQKKKKPLEVMMSLLDAETLPQKKKSPKPLKDVTFLDTLDGAQKTNSQKTDSFIEIEISPEPLETVPFTKYSIEKDKSPDDNISLDVLARQKRRLQRAMSRDSLDELPQKKKSQQTDKPHVDVFVKDLERTSPKKVSQKTVTFQDDVSIDVLSGSPLKKQKSLDDSISLDALGEPGQRRRRRESRDTPLKTPLKPKKKVTKKEKKNKASKAVDYLLLHGIKPCFVSLEREDKETLLRKAKNPSKYAYKTKITKEKPKTAPGTETAETAVNLEPIVAEIDKPEDTPVVAAETVVEEVVNDIDMLDVSEDIVIGDDMKAGEKEADSSNPDIILDNSQSSTEGTSESSAIQGETRIFDYSSDENLRRDSITVSGNGDAVLAVECIDNNFIAACLDGNVYYFSGDGQLLNTLRGSNLAVTCLTIVKEKYGTTVYTGSLDSRIRYYDLESGLEKGPECNVLSPIQTMDRAWGTIFVGTRTGFVLQFECKNNILIPVSTVKFSEQSILALRAMKEGPRKVLLVAARSEPVTIKDAQTGLLLRTLEGPKMTVYTLLFEDGKVYCGTSSQQIHVFDYVSGSHVGCHEGGKGAVCLRARGGLVFAGCYDGCVYVYREGQPAPLAQLKGPSLMLLSLAVHSTKVIAGYKDRSLYIWKIPHNILQEMVL